MANNYPPPFFGFPAEYMPQPTINRQSQYEQIPANSQNAPAPPPFPSIPGLPHHSSPSVNPPAQSPTTFQPPFTPTNLPSQLPQNWAALMPYIQNGTFPLPPFPGFPMPSAPPGIPPPTAQPPPPPQNNLVPIETRPERRDGDRDQVRMMERDVASHNLISSTTGQARPEPQVYAPQSTVSVPAQEAYNPDQPGAGQAPSHAAQLQPQQQQQQQQVSAFDANKHQKNKEEVRQFIRLLNSNNIGYGTLAKEDLDNEMLRELYKSLNLPSEPAPIPPPKPVAAMSSLPARPPTRNTTSQADISTVQQTKNSPSGANSNASSTKPAAAASPATCGDRKDYIARLQAAKLAKQANPPKPSPPQQSPVSASTPQPGVTPPAKQRVSDEERARNTALVKARLDAMNAVRAKQKQQPANSNGISTPVSKDPQSTPMQQVAQPVNATQTPRSAGAAAASTKESSFPGIPGLFMNSPASNVAAVPKSKPQMSDTPKTTGSVNPTATPTPRGSATPYSRSVQRSPYAEQDDSMIIEVSDDESAGSEMDIDDDHVPQEDVAITPQPAITRPQQPNNVLNDSSRNGSARPASSAVSTPGPQTPSSVGREKELEDKEKELAAMKITLKRKLAEKRARDKAAAEAAAAAASVNASKSSTPAPSMMVGNGGHQIAGNDGQVEAGPTKVASLPSSGSTRQSRRAEIQSRLPSLDAEIATNTKRMAQLTRELEELAAHNERMAKDKETLTKELEELGIDTEGMSHAELRATKDAIEHDGLDETMQNTGPDPEPANDGLTTTNAHTNSQQAIEEIQAPINPHRSNEKQAPSDYAYLPGLQQNQGSHTSPARSSTTAVKAAVEVHDPIVIEELVTTSVLPVSEGATPLDDDDFYSPPPPAVQDQPIRDAQDTAKQASGKISVSSSEEGEVEMSESDEEEYDPAISIDQGTHEEPSVSLQRGQQSDSEILVEQRQTSARADEEDYEPPDVDDAAAPAEASMSGAYPGEDDGAMDIVTSSDGDSEDENTDSDSDSDSDETESDSDEDLEQVTLDRRVDNPTQADSLTTQTTNVPFDIVPAVQHPAALLQPESDVMPNGQVEVPAFTAYESPLRYFKSYRYHPSYMQDVAGGFLSWTFSHQIDPQRTLCQYEGAGGFCNDPACPDQHFRDFGLTGDKLLLQLGTANPGKTEEDKKKWNDGLRGVLQELRKQNIKEPDGIATAIAKYRREFFHDDTRVVNL